MSQPSLSQPSKFLIRTNYVENERGGTPHDGGPAGGRRGPRRRPLPPLQELVRGRGGLTLSCSSIIYDIRHYNAVIYSG